VKSDTDRLLSNLYNSLHENLTQLKKAGLEHKKALREAVELEGLLMQPSTCKTRTIKYLWRFLAVICGLLSVYIVFSELLIFFDVKDYDFLTTAIPDVCLATVFLLYMALTAFYGLFNIRIASYYSLDPHSVNSYSLLYSCRMVSGITPPLCFNFLKMTGLQKFNSEFMAVMGTIDIVPIIGTDFQQFFPCFLLCLCVINYYDWWS
jgi:hypothetical protein